jgi:hypothetical protein
MKSSDLILLTLLQLVLISVGEITITFFAAGWQGEISPRATIPCQNTLCKE